MFLKWFPMIFLKAFSPNRPQKVSKLVSPRKNDQKLPINELWKTDFWQFWEGHDPCRPKIRRVYCWTRPVSNIGTTWHESCWSHWKDISESSFLDRNSWNFFLSTLSPSLISSHPQMHLKYPKNVKVTM